MAVNTISLVPILYRRDCNARDLILTLTVYYLGAIDECRIGVIPSRFHAMDNLLSLVELTIMFNNVLEL